MRILGQGGSRVGTPTPGTTGRIRLEGIFSEKATDIFAVPCGSVWTNDQTGWVPFGAAIVKRMREPLR